MERNEKDNTDEDLQEVNDIIFDEEREDNIQIETSTGRILLISFSKLIEIATSKNTNYGNSDYFMSLVILKTCLHLDPALVTTIFLTYRGFQTPKMLLLALIKR